MVKRSVQIPVNKNNSPCRDDWIWISKAQPIQGFTAAKLVQRIIHLPEAQTCSNRTGTRNPRRCKSSRTLGAFALQPAAPQRTTNASNQPTAGVNSGVLKLLSDWRACGPLVWSWEEHYLTLPHTFSSKAGKNAAKYLTQQLPLCYMNRTTDSTFFASNCKQWLLFYSRLVVDVKLVSAMTGSVQTLWLSSPFLIG